MKSPGLRSGASRVVQSELSFGLARSASVSEHTFVRQVETPGWEGDS